MWDEAGKAGGRAESVLVGLVDQLIVRVINCGLGASPLTVEYTPPPPTSSLGIPEMVQSDSSGKRGAQITRVKADLERSRCCTGLPLDCA